MKTHDLHIKSGQRREKQLVDAGTIEKRDADHVNGPLDTE